MTAAWLLAAGISRHGHSCQCATCARPVSPPPAVYVDTRPRVEYVLPDGTVQRVIFDIGDVAPPSLTCELPRLPGETRGRIVTIWRRDLVQP